MSRYGDTVWDHLVSVTVLARSRGCHCKRIGLYLNSQCQTSNSKQPLRGWANFAKQKIAENSLEAWSVAVQNFIFTSPSFLRNRSLHQRRVKPPAALSLPLSSLLSLSLISGDLQSSQSRGWDSGRQRSWSSPSKSVHQIITSSVLIHSHSANIYSNLRHVKGI